MVAVGLRTDRGYRLDRFDADAVAAGLRLEHRFATWDLRPWRDDAAFAVSLLRRPRLTRRRPEARPGRCGVQPRRRGGDGPGGGRSRVVPAGEQAHQAGRQPHRVTSR